MSLNDWVRGKPARAPKLQITAPVPDEANPNDHLRSYCHYYLTLARPPGYALLLSGLWGSGKTFQARKVLDELVGTERYLFVSLNGLSSRREIDDALFAAVYPWTQKKQVRIGAAVGKALLRHAKIDLPNLQSEAMMTRSASTAYVFDDFERCKLSRSETLGYINEFVERDGCKVIVIADESKIASDREYIDGKEKVIGKTLAVNADFGGALSYFILLADMAISRDIFIKYSSDIKHIYEQSQLQNLRILQQTMADFERVLTSLEERHYNHTGVMRHLIRLFFALSFEFRSGRIIADDLRNRLDKIVAGMVGEKNPTPMSDASSRYSGVELNDTILPDETLIDVLVRGVVNAEEVKSAVNSSSWFIQGDEPSWRSVWYSYERDDEATALAATAMMEDFRNRKFERSGELLHLFGQMLSLSDIGVIRRNRKTVTKECKRYIDDLRGAGRLEPILRRHEDGINFGAYGGLGFSQIETDEFKSLANYLSEQRKQAEIGRFSEEARRLANLALTDVNEFTSEIAFGSDRIATFAEVPVFMKLDASIFAGEIVKLPPWQFREVLLAFSIRYDMGALSTRLADERPWAEELERQIILKANKLNLFGRDRVKKMLQWSLTKELEKIRAAERAVVAAQN